MIEVPQTAAGSDETSAWEPRMVRAPDRLLRACDLPRLMTDDDGRGRVSALRRFVKDWAVAGDRRLEMIADAPIAYRRRHRWGRRRFDLARIAAVVHALCDRDDMPAPHWTADHRARSAVRLNDRKTTASKWDSHVRDTAPDACAAHNVWFTPADLDDYRIHGFR